MRWILSLFLQLICSAIVSGQNKDIVLSSRWFHPRNIDDQYSTIKAVADFKVDRIDWMYCENKSQLAVLKDLNIPYSLAINPQIPDSLAFTTLKGRMVDIKGNGYVAPWMKLWKQKNPYWGCVNNPDFVKLFLDKSKKIVDLGAYGIFVDDARFNDHAIDWGGGCYCKYCLNKFKTYLLELKIIDNPDFDYISQKETIDKNGKKFKNLYAEFQTKSVVSFLTNWREEVSRYANRPFKFITNNASGKWNDIYKVFDSGIAEISTKNNSRYTTVINSGSLASKINKNQVFSYAGHNVNENIAFYLFCYLSGYEAIIPWDTFINDQSLTVNRVFVNKNQISPIIDFIVKNPNLSKLKSIPIASLGIKVSASTLIICKQMEDNSILVFATNQSGDLKKKVTISLPKKMAYQQLLDNGQFPVTKGNQKQNQLSGELIFIKI